MNICGTTDMPTGINKTVNDKMSDNCFPILYHTAGAIS